MCLGISREGLLDQGTESGTIRHCPLQGLGWGRREGGIKSLKKKKRNKEEKEGKGKQEGKRKEKEQKLTVVI